jgi:hypothetical protein
MKSLRPEQIILLLVFVLVPLFNLLVRWLQRRAREQQRRAPAEPPMAESAPPAGWPSRTMPPRIRVIEPPLPQEAPHQETRRKTPPAAVPARRRAAPLGGPAAVRRTIVAMTILGPCRGLEEPPPGPLVGSSQQGADRR